MYKAIKNIGEYKIGDEVPAEQAQLWLKMYAVPHVELVGDESTQVSNSDTSQDDSDGSDGSDDSDDSDDSDGSDGSDDSDDSDEPKGSSNNVMFDDYLGRNANVVIKNIEEDNLTKEQLESLSELEKSKKKRSSVIDAIKIKLEAL